MTASPHGMFGLKNSPDSSAAGFARTSCRLPYNVFSMEAIPDLQEENHPKPTSIETHSHDRR